MSKYLLLMIFVQTAYGSVQYSGNPILKNFRTADPRNWEWVRKEKH